MSLRNPLFVFFLCLLFPVIAFSQESYPEGFAQEVAYDEFNQPAGILFTESPISVVWELDGKVWMINDGVVSPDPFIDISDEVARWGDHGMLGAVLHPEFLQNGYIYLWYSVDRHHLKNFGTSNYDPEVTEEFTVAMGRLTRYTVDVSDFEKVLPESRKVLIGNNIDDGLPICAPSHGVGALLFGEDGSLLITSGDGNTWVGSTPQTGYNGEGPPPEFGYDDIALEDGILSEDQNLGAFRAQYLDGLNGKVLRINPETGEGIANNPFYNSEAPDSPRSKIWSLGLRNPYRMALKPGTGGGNLENGNPGTLYVGDVGDWEWEEINVVREGGLNFGWPMFQGPIHHNFYDQVKTLNTNAPNNLSGNECTPFLYYQDVIVQPNRSHTYFYPNPCNVFEQLPENIETFVHERPALAFRNNVTEEITAVIPTYTESGEATFMDLNDPESGVEGESFNGISGTSGVFLEGDQIPEEYQGWYLFGDFTGWVRAAKFDETEELEAVELWHSSIGSPIHFAQNPSDGCVYVTSIFPSEIIKICFGGNLRPVLNVTPDVIFGVSPQEVVLDASQSFDPEGGNLSFLWDLGDGTSKAGPTVSHIFQSPDNSVTNSTVKLTVRDSADAESTFEIPVSLNNTPPQTEIVSLIEGELYSALFPTIINLVAETNDSEHLESQLNYEWELILHHNTHFHSLAETKGNNQIFQIYPTGCSEVETYWYEILLTTTDPGGLSSVDSKNIFSDCEGELNRSFENDRDFIIVPNPGNNIVELRSVKDLGESMEFELYSSDGSIVKNEILPVYNERQFVQIDIRDLSPGAYILKFKVGNDWHKERLIKVNN